MSNQHKQATITITLEGDFKFKDDTLDLIANRVYTMLHAQGGKVDVTVRLDEVPDMQRMAAKAK